MCNHLFITIKLSLCKQINIIRVLDTAVSLFSTVHIYKITTLKCKLYPHTPVQVYADIK